MYYGIYRHDCHSVHANGCPKFRTSKITMPPIWKAFRDGKLRAHKKVCGWIDVLGEKRLISLKQLRIKLINWSQILSHFPQRWYNGTTKLINVWIRALVGPYPEYWAPFLVICAQERWIETEIYPWPLKQDNQGNEEPLSSEEMETFGFFSLEKQKLREEMIALISRTNTKRGNKDFWR